MPSCPIVDSHVHFWNPAEVPLPWTETVPPLARAFGPDDLDQAAAGVEIEGIVFVECDVAPGRHLDEVQWVKSLAAKEPRLRAVVAHAPLEKGAAVEADLAVLAREPLVRGIRRLLQGEADAEFCLRPAFIEGLRLLPTFGFHFEICIYHHQFDAALELVRRVPEVHFVLDHIGKPAIRDGLMEPWRTRMRELASLPNVVCKLSGLVTEADHAAWTPARLRPYIDHTVDCFGPARLMFGSDWPVATLATSYPRWVRVLDEALAGVDADALRAFWNLNATAFYRLTG